MELLVVMPVYNEQDAVATVVDQWIVQLDASGASYTMVALDDGSTDATPSILKGLREKWGSKFEVVSQKNSGHGQAALKGYKLAVERGVPWVFQIDSDGQCDPVFFPKFWSDRVNYDIVSGYRASRDDGIRRVVVSVVLRWFIYLAFGLNCPDANVPYRLMRTNAIAPLITKIPSTFFLANVGLATLAVRARLRHKYIPIAFRDRHGGQPTIPYSRFGGKATELHSQLKDLLKD